MIFNFLILILCLIGEADECSAIKLNGYSKGEVPVKFVNNAIGLDIENSCKFEYATLYVTGKGFSEPVTLRLFSEKFDDELIRLFRKIKSEHSIIVDEIRIKNKQGVYINCNRIVFKVVK